MYSINDVVRSALDANAIATCELFTDEDRLSLLSAIRDSIPTGIAGIPYHAEIIRSAISRRIDEHTTSSAAGTVPQAQKQGRKTKRVEKPTEVDAGATTQEAEGEAGETQGG
jgi:hypothetical protein